MSTNSTIDYYNNNASEYAADTFTADMSNTYARFLSYLQPRAHIFDIGCGSGRDSKHFTDNGFFVTAMDASEKMCDYSSKMIGKPVLCMTFDQIDFVSCFDAAWACASLLHIGKQDINKILKRISTSLKPNGILYMSFKYGSQEYEKDGRHFSDYSESDIPLLCSVQAGLLCKEWWISSDVRPNRQEGKWLNIIAEKMVRL